MNLKLPVLDFQHENTLADKIPYKTHATENIIKTRDGEYLSIWKIDGKNHDCASQEDAFLWHAELNNLLREVGSDKIGLWLHEHHYSVDLYPDYDYPSKYTAYLDRRYKRRFENKPAMVTDLYLTVIYNPLSDTAQKAIAKLEKSSLDDIRAREEEAITELQSINGQIGASLKDYGSQLLGFYRRDAKGRVVGDNDPSARFIYSSALEWLSYLINGAWTPVPYCSDFINEYLAETRPMSGLYGEMLEFRLADKKRFAASIEIVDYEEHTEPGQLNMLKEADYEYIFTQSFKCMSADAAKSFLTRRQSTMLEVKDGATSQQVQLNRAKDDAVSRRFIFGHHHATVLVYGESPKIVRKHLEHAKNSFSRWGIKPGVCNLSSEAAFFAMLPCNWEYRPRPVPINSWNLFSFQSFHNFYPGKPDQNPWGPAVTLFASKSGSPFFFNWHPGKLGQDDTDKRLLGHSMILGQSGEGKTTLLAFLLAQGEKFGNRLVVYDKDTSLKPLVLALGGVYKRILDGEPTGWQPMQMEPTPSNIAFCKRLLTKLVELSGEKVNHKDESDISQAVESVMASDFPKEGRTLTAVMQHLPAPYDTNSSLRSTVASRLLPWCRGNQYGWLFDNPRDDLDLSVSSTYGYDLTAFLSDGADTEQHRARSPLLMYLMYRNNQLVDGEHRHIEVFEEFWKYLDDPDIERQIKDGLLTRRKFDSLYVFSTQEPEAALNSRITATIRQQLATLIMLPNPKGEWDSYKKLRLSRSEFDTMKDLRSQSREFIVKQDDRCAIARFDLGDHADDLLTVLSGTPDASERLDAIIERRGPHPDAWLDEFMERREP
nr:VirB4 family type IV secretion/conjugal transfer ATPase [uncultured Halomonas sp.]